MEETQCIVPSYSNYIYFKNIYFQCLAIHEKEYYRNVFAKKILTVQNYLPQLPG